MAILNDFLRRGTPVGASRPWPRVMVDAEAWLAAGESLAQGELSLLGLWGEPGVVHLALLESGVPPAMLSLACPDGSFPSVARHHAPADRLERAIADIVGLRATRAPDARPWLDHGRWMVKAPLGAARPSAAAGEAYPFLPAEGESLHQIPVGPVHAGIIEPGHFRFTASGETVVRLEQRLGYVHKGIEGLMIGATLDRAGRLAGRISGDSTVAYAVAFGQAVEAATGTEIPRRAAALRGVMAELERLANHLGDIGAICNDASFSIMLAHLGVLREEVLRTADRCFGHRLMMDRVVPGGVAVDLTAEGREAIKRLIDLVRARFPKLVGLYDNTASLQDRTVGTGILKAELARRYAAGGFIGRASGRGFDARKAIAYPPYDRLSFDVPVREDGDVNARVWVRIEEIDQSLALIEQLVDALPAGPLRAELSSIGGSGAAEGAALVEGFRGDVFVWLRLRPDSTIERCHLRDPSWFQWPLLEAAIEGNIVADFPLCNKSFNCSYSGHDG